jgi:hypothetical protein
VHFATHGFLAGQLDGKRTTRRLRLFAGVKRLQSTRELSNPPHERVLVLDNLLIQLVGATHEPGLILTPPDKATH